MLGFLKHIYMIIMMIFCVMMGNVLAVQYGTEITATISSLWNGTDSQIENVQKNVEGWNKKIQE